MSNLRQSKVKMQFKASRYRLRETTMPYVKRISSVYGYSNPFIYFLVPIGRKLKLVQT